MVDRMKCDTAPDGRHCLHSPGAWYSTQRAPEKCCWCGEVVQTHGPHAPQGGEIAARWEVDLRAAEREHMVEFWPPRIGWRQ